MGIKEKLMRRSKSEVWILIKKVVGIILVVVGIFGLFLPLLQGVLLIILGIALFENKSIRGSFHNLVAKLKNEPKGF